MKALWAWIQGAFKWLECYTQFLDDKNGKFSFKRGVGIACLVTSIIFAFRGAGILAIIYLAATIVIAIVCAVTGT